MTESSLTRRATPEQPSPGTRRLALTLLLLGIVVVHTTMFLSRPVVSYRVLALNGDETAVGLVVAAGAVLPILLAIPMGKLSDRGRTPLLLLCGAVVLVGGPVGLANADSIPGIALVNAVYGFGHLALMVGSQAIVAGLSRPGQRDRNFGLFTAAASLGQMFGPLTAGWVLAAAGSDPLLHATTKTFVVAAAIAVGAIVAFGLLVFVLRGTTTLAPSSHGTDQPAGKGSALALLADRQLATAVFVSCTFIAAVDLLIAYLPVLGQAHGLSPAFVGALLAARAGFSFVSRMFIGVLVGWAGRLLVIVLSAGIAAVTGLGFVITSHPALLIALMVVLGLTLGLGQPLTMSWVVEQAPQRMRATALALRITGNRVAQTAAPAGAGAFSTVIGGAGPFVLTTVLLGAAAASVVPFLRRSGHGAVRRRKRREPPVVS